MLINGWTQYEIKEVSLSLDKTNHNIHIYKTYSQKYVFKMHW